MTDEQIRIAVAEAIPNWTVHHGGRYCAITNCENPDLSCRLFDPLQSESAMHEAWCSLTDDEHKSFINQLLTIVLRDGHVAGPCRSVCNATAKQRAEAFLRTKGLWRDAQ